MPLYGTAQAGGFPTVIYPGDSFTLFDGTETAGAAVKSIAFRRGLAPGGLNPGTTFQIVFPSSSTDSLVIQGSNLDVDADYITLATSTSKQTDFYTDTGDWAYYRAQLITYSGGGMPQVIAQR